jgi:hypothetical protein
MTQVASRLPPHTRRSVNVARLRELIPDGDVSKVARKMAGEPSRRMIQRARSGKGVSQANAEWIAEVLGVPADEFLLPRVEPDRRLAEFRRLARRAEELRRELGLPLDAYTHG